MSNITRMLAEAVSPATIWRARAKVLAREDRQLRSELVRIRRQNQLTQKEVAALLDVTPQAVQKLERYDADPKLSTLRRYANAVGAIIEHRVAADLGQSLAMAASPRWESTGTPGTTANLWRVAASAAPSQPNSPGADWSELRRSSFALGA